MRSSSRSRRRIRSRRVTSRAWPTAIRKSPSSRRGGQQSGESLALLEKARAIEKGLINRYPDKHAYQKSLAEITNVLGYAYYKLGNNRRGAQVVSRGPEHLPTVSKQVTVGPKPLWLIEPAGAQPFQYRAGFTRKSREFEDALKSFEQSLEYRSALADSHPSVTEYKVKLGLNCREIALVQHEAHQDAKAFQSIRAVRSTSSRLSSVRSPTRRFIIASSA